MLLRRTARPLLALAALLLVVGPAAGIDLPDHAERAQLADGAWAFHYRVDEGPLAIYGVYWQRRQPRLRLHATLGHSALRGVQPTSRQAVALTDERLTPLAAVNGDFFTMRGATLGAVRGFTVIDGELLAANTGRHPAVLVGDNNALGVERPETAIELHTDDGRSLDIDSLNHYRAENQLALYTPRWGEHAPTNRHGTELRLRWHEPETRLQPDMDAAVQVVDAPVQGQGQMPLQEDELVLSAHGSAQQRLAELEPGQTLNLRIRTTPQASVRHAVGGGPRLVRDGEITYRNNDGPRHPRSAIGFNDEHVLVLVVDGRRPDHSVGVTLGDLARLMYGLGCDTAMNLDGGGSTTLWAAGDVLNRPAGALERPVANALILVHDPQPERR